MTQSHYSLRWNNHQSHILSAFDALLQAETLVDVTLVCAETSVRAHKVVLSACSPFFQRIFSENPCKHPVIVLKDFNGWEVQAIVDFMYKGEISVGQEQLQNLIKAAESLQVRGLAHQDHFGGSSTTTPAGDKEASSSITNQTPTPSASPNDYERGFFPTGSRFPTPGTTMRTTPAERSSPFSPLPGPYESQQPPLKLPHMSHLTFPPETLLSTNQRLTDCSSPLLPRRKQARPRRRSGEMCMTTVPQDLTKGGCTSPPQQHSLVMLAAAQQLVIEETAENLCMKKPNTPQHQSQQQVNHREQQLHHREHQQQQHREQQHREQREQQHMLREHHREQQRERDREHRDREQREHQKEAAKPHEMARLKVSPDRGSPELDLSMPDKEYAPSPPLSLPPTLSMVHDAMDSHSPLPFPPMPSVSALAMTPPHSKFFGLDSPLGLFPPGLDGCRNPLLDMDPRNTPDTQMFAKKKMGRPKGQHSAPRGGPPRSWTNAELTEALQHVWNKKMTTSQASRIFGIPYNSLLMYVRGKYGKSLKLEQLRKDCIGGPGAPMDLLNLGAAAGAAGNNNNNSCKTEREPIEQVNPNTRPSSTEDPMQTPVFNPFAPNFYPDFGTGFPIPVSMIHLLPQSEKNREHFGGGHQPQLTPGSQDDDVSSIKSEREREHRDRVKELDDEHQAQLQAQAQAQVQAAQDLFRSPALTQRELVQQNGQD